MSHLSIHVVANSIMGLALFSLAAACAFGLRRNTSARWLNAVFALFFILAAVGRFLKATEPDPSLSMIAVIVDALGAVAAIVCSLNLWPLYIRMQNLPSYAELQNAYQKLDAARDNIAAIVEASQDAIIGKDLNGIITSWNHGAEEMYGYTAAEAVGMPIEVLSPPERREEIKQILEATKRGERVSDLETVRIAKNGERKDVLLAVSPIRDKRGEITGAAVVARDVTKLMAAERQIRLLNEELSGRVMELSDTNAALQGARDKAIEASTMKSAFVANISHELRTPLSGILGLNEILLQMEMGPEQRQLVEMVHQSAQSLLAVVNDILDLSKIEAGKITLEYDSFNPVFLIQDSVRLMAPTALRKQLDFTVEIDEQVPEMVYGDSARVRQVLLNLIGNAIKFTEHGSVRITARVREISAEQVAVMFSVSDTGIGISAEHQKLLFSPFSQVDSSTTRRFGGTGLGLAISKQLVQLMQGRIGVNSKPNEGSTFWFLVPFDRKRVVAPTPAETNRESDVASEPINADVTRGRRVLVVEDNAVLQQLALRQLSNLGVAADGVTYGREAINEAMSGKYDLILMDFNLPDITGLEATEAIRDLEKSAERAPIPIVAMTAGAMAGDKERALRSGMNDYVAKPVTVQRLKRIVEYWLKQTPLRRAS